jgi:imidazolonepropionase-like amidohydrolase
MPRVRPLVVALVSLSFVFTSLVHAQRRNGVDTYAITNARIVTVSGATIDRGTVVIRAGLINAVGANVNAPPDARIIDGAGLTIYPGLIDSYTNLALPEPASSPSPGGSGGFVAAQPRPSPGGPNSTQPPGLQPEVMVEDVIRPGGAELDRVCKMLRDAEAYGRAQDAYAKDRSLPRPDQNVVLEPLVPYVRGERPVIFRADREAEILGAIRFAEEMKLKPIILGGDDAWKVASLLKEKDVPVILTGVFSLPLREDDFYDTLYENPAKLQQAGVRFCISTGDAGAEVRNLPLYAGMAAAYGLSKTDALMSVTLYPAQIMNVADRLGSIDVGKMANLVVTDGDLLEIRTHIRYLFIDGRPVVLTSRHTELNDAFKNRR